MAPTPFHLIDSVHPASPRRPSAAGRLWTLGLVLCCCLIGVPSTAAAGDASVSVEDAQVEANQPGTFPLPFTITRGGDTADGVRILVETTVGGSNPGAPGEDYTPLPPGTEVFIAPDATTGTATVEVIGDPVAGPDETLLLQLTGAQAFAPEPRLEPNAMHYRVCCLTRDLATADVNGDGHPDIFTGNDLSANVSVLLSDGEGGFADAVDYPVAGNVSLFRVVVTVADVTGDGHADVVATGFNSTNIEVFAGDGSGTFATPPILAPLGTGDVPTAVVAVDVNGDGNQDILTSDGTDNTVSVLLGDGDGGFSAAESFPTGAFPNGLAVAEVTGDDHLDVVTSNGEGDDVSVLAGDGNGHFTAPQQLSIGPEATPLSVTVADATGDGVPDIVTANQFGGGGFPPPETPGTVSVLAGDGAGGFDEALQISLQGALGRAQEVAVGDVTADGEPDIVAARPIDGTVTLLAGDGAGGFEEPRAIVAGWGPNPVAIADLTADGHLDVVTANAVGENLSILPGDGEGNVGFSAYYRTGQFPHSVVSVDLNHDGFADIASADAFDANVSVLVNDGAGGFADAASHAVGISPLWITTGDIDGNGDPDLITANASGTVSVLLGDGAGGLAEAMNFSVAEGFHPPYAVAVADINDDGDQDIATANTDGFSTSSISVLLADGAGGFLDPILIEGATQTSQSIALADVTGDDDIDILVTSFEDAEVVLLVGDGTGGFDDPVSFATDIGPVFVVVADVTGDDNPDLVSLNHTGQSVSVLVGDGAGGFDDASHFDIFDVAGLPCTDPNSGGAGCPWPWGLAVADVTGDGAPDIVTANTNNSTVSVLPNDGGGDFPSFTAYDTGAHPGAAAVADVTGDGNFDIVTANREGHNVGVLTNLLGGVELADDEGLGTIIRSGGSGPVLTFDPPLLAFGEVEVGDTSPPMTSTLHNNGVDDATDLEFLNPASGFDADTSGCGDTLPAGASCAVSITFTPPAAGPAEATLSVSASEGASANLPLSGLGVGEGFTPMALEVDPPVLASSGNGVFEPGEAVGVAPTWRNDSEDTTSLTGMASAFGGPEGAAYSIDFDTADYDLVEPGELASCLGTEVCYQLQLDDPAVRPAAHWEAVFEETLDDADETTKTWTLHIGESFADVPSTNPFYPAIETLLHSGVTGGCTDGRHGGRPLQGGAAYCPGGANSRAQMPVFVLRALMGSDYTPPPCVEGDDPFGDVPFDSPFCPWIQDLANRGIVSGCGDGDYCPSSPVSRAQMSIFLLKTLEGSGYSPPECNNMFDDVPCPSLFADWIEDLAAREITSGCSETEYCPGSPVSRAQMAVFVTRTFGLTLYGP